MAVLYKYQSLDLGPTLLQHDLILTKYIYKDPVSKEGYILKFQVDLILGRHCSIQ